MKIKAYENTSKITVTPELQAIQKDSSESFSMEEAFESIELTSSLVSCFESWLISRNGRCACTHRGGALDDVTTVVAIAGHQPEPLAGVLVLA